MRRLMNKLFLKLIGKIREKHGFTLAELLIVIAIIAVLSGVIFIAVWTYLRSMGQLERDGIAKQIFVAAQNHLSAAKGEGYLGKTKFGTQEMNGSQPTGVYYLVANRGTIADGDSDIFELMLPFGSIDETVRAGGNYVIRYNKDNGTVLDVFYCSSDDSTKQFNHRFFDNDDYAFVCSRAGDSIENKRARRTYVNNSILGWYGGATGAALTYIDLKAPEIEVINAERLYVRITDPNSTDPAVIQQETYLRLIITGVSSEAEHYLDLQKVNNNEEQYEVVLDDITEKALHFCNRSFSGTNSKVFYPGEDIRIQAMISGISTDENRAYTENRSQQVTTNSLFAAIHYSEVDGKVDKAYIENIRHLENLDIVISKLATNDKIAIQYADQIDDLYWKDGNPNTADFISEIKAQKKLSSDPSVTGWEDGQTQEGYYMPISPDYPLEYTGQNHSISGVLVNLRASSLNTVGTADAGMFGHLSVSGSKVENLELINFSVSGEKAGALAGSTGTVKITNVLARNNLSYTANQNIVNASIIGTSSTGGLIGYTTGTTVENSAAALVVNGGGSAGGLIGSMSGGSVTASYAGGHTENAEYWNHNADGERTDGIYNVRTDSGAAGGLIGSMSGGTVSGSYSTCSASGTTAGGFVGTGSGNISNCYCTGLVSGNTKGAFAGSLSGTVSNCRYFEIINEVQNANQGYTCLSSVGGGASNSGITAFDASAKSYNEFCGAPANWQLAQPYDATLEGRYQGKYNLKTINQLDPSIGTSGFAVSAHYGDWPAPEAFVVNNK